VANENGQIVNVISQSDVIRFLVPTMDQYVTLFDKTAEELGLGLLPPITIRDTEPTIKALQIIGRNRISALAVVDENGKLVGNLSASDLKVR
jgi:CBS domain-containing protein